MSISTEISRISQNVSDSLTAVAAKGVTVPSGANSDDLPTLIASIQTGGGGIKYATGSYTAPATYDSAGNRPITTIANIGFTPTKFIFAVKNQSDISGKQNAVVRVSYEAVGNPTHYMRLCTRYTNTSNALGNSGTATDWTTQSNQALYLSGGTIYFRTMTNHILFQNIEYVWYAYE